MRSLYFWTAPRLRLFCNSVLYLWNLGCKNDVLKTEGRSPKIARGVHDEYIQERGRKRQDVTDSGAFCEGPEEEEEDSERGLSEYIFRLSSRSSTAWAELITIVVLPETRKWIRELPGLAG